MNREERRKLQKDGYKPKKEQVFNLKASDIVKIKEDATNKAFEDAFIYALGIPVLILKDKFGQLMRVNVDGKNREERFTEMCLEWFENVNLGLLNLEEVKECLKDECGIVFEKGDDDRIVVNSRNN